MERSQRFRHSLPRQCSEKAPCPGRVNCYFWLGVRMGVTLIPKFQVPLKPMENNNIPLLLIQVADGCKRKLLPFCLWEERTHKHVAVVLITVFVLQTLQGLLCVSVKTPQLCFQACVLAKPSIMYLLSAFICSYTRHTLAGLLMRRKAEAWLPTGNI